ncbi:hypothetical protein K0M31_019488 [Melipona bicolor]|uniref:Uncharacterized protein n=1 Tax=Melipona bicolor TaxID=60889 RepID=A0AA40G2D0_9HYME|nr:hypothetical protein K0M31_019488 [Melipona bicolor]
MVANLQSQHGNTVPLCEQGNLPDVPQAEATVKTRYKRRSSKKDTVRLTNVIATAVAHEATANATDYAPNLTTANDATTPSFSSFSCEILGARYTGERCKTTELRV